MWDVSDYQESVTVLDDVKVSRDGCMLVLREEMCITAVRISSIETVFASDAHVWISTGKEDYALRCTSKKGSEAYMAHKEWAAQVLAILNGAASW